MPRHIIYLEEDSSWPSEIRMCLERDFQVLLDWYQSSSYQAAFGIAQAYDRAIKDLTNAVQDFYLHGFHCTRLTESEIRQVLANGMSLPNLEMLSKRIAALKKEGLVSDAVAARLLTENEAQADNRMNKIWFCFFKPSSAPQSGIERFFRSWGGEALYNSHEEDPLTGSALKKIGTPCIIEAIVPLASINDYGLSLKLAKQFLMNRGIIKAEKNEYEWYSSEPIPSTHIKRVVRYPDNEFLSLTNCYAWKPPLVS